MTTYNWQVFSPIEAIVFDCDGTLSSLEGIDEIAKHNGVGDIVTSLTSHAMAKSGMSPELYEQRLTLVKPHYDDLIQLGCLYDQHRIPDVGEVIQLLTRLNKTIYLVSAGLYPSVALFGEKLHIPQENIYAVEVLFDELGHYRDFNRQTPLVTRNGKREIIKQLKKRHPTILHIGDGLNDFEVYDLVTRFVGFGGMFYRENIAAQCEFYIKSMSMAPLLPLVLTDQECRELSGSEDALYQKGLSAVHDNQVLFNQPA